jgi:HAD superfamily hydrolase (TIGR01509 family)
MVKALIFDMDGVVVLSGPVFARIFSEKLSRDFDIQVSPDEFRMDGNRWESSIIKALHKRGIKIADEEAKKIATECRSRYAKEFGLSTNPGWLEFTEEAKKKGYRVALGTNGSKVIVDTLLRKMSLDVFDAVVTFDDVKEGKPSPDIYLRCASILKVHPKDCIVFEDSLTGIIAAKRAGMRCIALTTSVERQFLLDADKIIDSFYELKVDEL